MKLYNENDVDEPKKLQEDDLAIVIRPLIEDGKWTGKVDLNGIIMPLLNLSDKDHDLVKDSMYAMVTCYHLLNTDTEFAKRINYEMDKLLEEGDLESLLQGEEIKSGDLTTWTKTKGSA